MPDEVELRDIFAKESQDWSEEDIAKQVDYLREKRKQFEEAETKAALKKVKKQKGDKIDDFADSED